VRLASLVHVARQKVEETERCAVIEEEGEHSALFHRLDFAAREHWLLVLGQRCFDIVGVYGALVSASPHAAVVVDLGILRLPDRCRVDYPLDPFRKTSLAEGLDEIEYVLHQAQVIQAFEQRAESAVGPI
jgi:hypothetical protein